MKHKCFKSADPLNFSLSLLISELSSLAVKLFLSMSGFKIYSSFLPKLFALTKPEALIASFWSLTTESRLL